MRICESNITQKPGDSNCGARCRSRSEALNFKGNSENWRIIDAV